MRWMPGRLATWEGKRRRRLGGPLAGALAGLLVALSLPPFGWWPLGWVGVAVLYLTLPGRSWKGRAAVGLSFGLVDYVIGLLWVDEFSVPGYIGVVLISLVYAALGVVAVPAGRRRYLAVALPCTFVLADWVRDRYPLGGLPLGGISLGQSTSPLAPTLRLGGALALTAETVLAGVVVGELLRVGWVLARRRLRDAPPTAAATHRRGLAALAAVAVAVPVIGLLSPTGAGGHLPALRVALVQGGGKRGTRAVDTDPQIVFDRQMAASATLQAPLNLVVWPEGMLQVFVPFQRTGDGAELAALAQRLHTTLLVGIDQNISDQRYLNEVVAFSPTGQVVGTYVKNHLVPFGEYVPYRSFISKYFNVNDVPYDGVAGHSNGLLRTPAGPLAMMISYEVFFDGRARGGVDAGGELLVVPTDTASYRSTQVPTQEVAADRLRAWETGRWLVQVTPTGYSNIVSPDGRVLRTTSLDEQAVVEASVPLRDGKTLFDRIGGTPVSVAALVLWLGVVGVAARAGRRRRRDGDPAPTPI